MCLSHFGFWFFAHFQYVYRSRFCYIALFAFWWFALFIDFYVRPMWISLPIPYHFTHFTSGRMGTSASVHAVHRKTNKVFLFWFYYLPCNQRRSICDQTVVFECIWMYVIGSVCIVYGGLLYECATVHTLFNVQLLLRLLSGDHTLRFELNKKVIIRSWSMQTY